MKLKILSNTAGMHILNSRIKFYSWNLLKATSPTRNFFFTTYLKPESINYPRRRLELGPPGYYSGQSTVPPLMIYAAYLDNHPQKFAIGGCFIDFPYRGHNLMDVLIDSFFHYFPDIKHYHPNSRNIVLQARLISKYGFKPLYSSIQPNAWIASNRTKHSDGIVYATSPLVGKEVLSLDGKMGLNCTLIEKSIFEIARQVKKFTPLYIGHTLIRP